MAAPRSWHGRRLQRHPGVARQFLGRCALRRVHRDCDLGRGGLGTLMRHDLLGALSLAVAQGPTGMREASRATALVAPPSAAHRLAPGMPGALQAAIPLATVTATAHQHPHAAAGTVECPGAALHLALPRSTHRRLANEASTSPPQPASAWGRTPMAGAILRTHSQRSTHEWGAAASPLCKPIRPPRPPSRPDHRSTASRTHSLPSARDAGIAAHRGGWGEPPGKSRRPSS